MSEDWKGLKQNSKNRQRLPMPVGGRGRGVILVYQETNVLFIFKESPNWFCNELNYEAKSS